MNQNYLEFNNWALEKEVLHFSCHSFANAPKKITGTVFRKNQYVSQLAPDLPTGTANSFKKQINTP